MTTTAAVSTPHVAGPPELPTLTAAAPGRGAGPVRAAMDAFLAATGEAVVKAAGDFVLEGSGIAGRKAPAPRTTTPKELAFLDDPRMSVHEKVFRLMKYISLKYDREVEAQMKKFKEQQAAKAEKGGVLKKLKKTFVGKALDRMKIVLPAVGLSSALLESPAGKDFLKQVSGPVLAAACAGLGMPQLAPLAAQLGPSLVDGLADAQEALIYEDGAGASSSKAATGQGASASSSSSSSGSKAVDEKDLALELQYLLEKQKTMTTMLSNAMKSMHDTSMAIVGNMR